MSISELKKKLMPQERKSDTATEISQTDIDLIERNKNLIWKTPLVIFGVLFTSKLLLRKMNIPSLMRNPLSPAEKFKERKRFWDYFMSNHMIFLGTSASLVYSVVYYEMTKYYLFTKYENLINAYLDASEKHYFKQLVDLNKAYELKKTGDLKIIS